MKPDSFESQRVADSVTVHRYKQSERGFIGNSYLVETEEAIVSIDTPMHREDGQRLQEFYRSLDKPLSAVFHTHAHPDHYLWTELLVEDREVPIYATPQLVETFHEVDEANRERWKPIYGDAYPDETLFPTDTIDDGETISVGGVDITAHHMGDGEGPDMAMYTLDDANAAFPNDMLFTNTHAFIGEGETEGWLDQIEQCREIVDEEYTLFAGHGPPAGTLALDFQAAYLVAYREAVRALADEDGRLNDEAIDLLQVRIERIIPDGAMPDWIRLSAKPVAAELAGREFDPTAGAQQLREFVEAYTDEVGL